MLPLDFPTDRWDDSPDVGVGVDTVAVIGPTTDALLDQLDHQAIDRLLDSETGELYERRTRAYAQISVALGSANVHAWHGSAGAEVRVEVSLPRMLNGHNRNALDRRFLADGVDAALHLLTEELPDVPTIDMVRVQRLDLARDFHHLSSPSDTLATLSHRHVARAQTNDVHRRSDGSVQTLVRGSKTQYLVRGYAKGNQLEQASRDAEDAELRRLLASWAAVSEGQLRYELQLRRSTLRKNRMNAMKDCSPEALDAVARAFYSKVGWDQPYSGCDRIRETLMNISDDVTPAEWRNLMVYVFAYQVGIDPKDVLSRHALEAARPVARRLHLLEPSEPSPTRRLDFDAGREVDV